jgi:exonuclease VII small subunit
VLVPPRDAEIDRLYTLPLTEFTAARNALAKTLPKEAAATVRKLEKPTTTAWTVNQLYWHDRHAWTRLMKAGQALRSAQIAALEGSGADLRSATTAHRSAVAHAVRRALEIAAPTIPAADQLTRMLEAISLAADAPAQPGRFTDMVQPSGFEALAGVTPAGRVPSHGPHAAPTPPHAGPGRGRRAPAAERPAAQRRADEAAAERARAVARQSARADLERATRAHEHALAASERASREVEEASHRLSRATAERERLQAVTDDARRELERARAALDRLDQGAG